MLAVSFSACDRLQNIFGKKNAPATEQEPSEPAPPDLNYTETLMKLNEHIQLQPQNPELFYARANEFLRLNMPEKSFPDIFRAMQLDSTRAKYYITLSELYFNQRELIRAINALEKGNAEEPENTDVLLLLCKYHLYLKDYDKAIVYADNVLKINSGIAEAYFLKGLIFKEIGMKDKALSSFQTAVEQNPEMYEAYMQLGLLTEEKDKKRAIAYYENALRIDSNSTEARYAKAMVFQQQKQYEKAKEVYREIIITDYQFERAPYNLGYIYFQQDSLEKAIRHFEMAIDIQPYYDDAFYMLGLCEEVLGNYKEAEYFFVQCLNITPKHELALEGQKRAKAKKNKP